MNTRLLLIAGSAALALPAVSLPLVSICVTKNDPHGADNACASSARVRVVEGSPCGVSVYVALLSARRK